MKKPLAETPPRLQRMLLKIQKYMNVSYRRGKELVIADALSRNFLPEAVEDDDSTIPICMVTCLPMSLTRIAELKAESGKDPIMKELQKTIHNGWPELKSQLATDIRPYWDIRDQLTVEEGIIFKADKVVVPSKLRQMMLWKIHESHQGIEKSKRLARDIMYWPGMSAQISDMVARCEICSAHQNMNQKEPMIAHEIPLRPWQKIGADLCELGTDSYLVLVDFYSNFIEICKLTSTKSSAIIRNCKQQFARYGIPDHLISDNGPQFASCEFRTFTNDYQIKHTTSSPHYPQSNGRAEKAVQIVKQLLTKAKADTVDPYLALLDLRNTPRDGLPSPAQLFFGRRTQTRFPTSPKLLQPQTISDVPTKIHEKQQMQKLYYDRGAKSLPSFEAGQSVLLRDNSKWKPATIITNASTPRSYIVQTPEGINFRRNRRDLRKSLHTPIDFDIETPRNTEQKEVEKSQSPTVCIRRSGRTIQTPAYLRDYVTK